MRDKYKAVTIKPSLDKMSTPLNPILDAKRVAENIQELEKWIINATRSREVDLQDYDNQATTNPVIYDTPSSGSDLRGTEKVGDIAVDSGFLYVVVDDGGLVWKKTALSTI